MAVLEKVMQMKEAGYTETQIINTLRGEGATPKDIYDALTQAKIKSEVTQVPDVSYETEDMDQSMNQNPVQEEYIPQAPQDYSPQEQYIPQEQQPIYSQYQQYSPQSSSSDMETINEMIEQVVEEKTTELKKLMMSFKNSKDEMKLELDKLGKRVDKIENSFYELQMAILKKIGEYGENIKNISSEMHETQNSFSKVLNPLTDNLRELQKITGKGSGTKMPEEKNNEGTIERDNKSSEVKRTKKSEPGFENYLR